MFAGVSEELDGEAHFKAKECFLQGYRSEKVLEVDFEEKLPVMRRFCNLYSYARLIRCVAEEVPDAPEWMRNLKKRLMHKIKQLESSIKQ